MAEKHVQGRLALLRKTTAEWAAVSSTVLLAGEIGIEVLENGAHKIKIGDGITTWANLGYFGGVAGMQLVDNAVNGDLAGLDSTGQATDSGIAASTVVTTEKFLNIDCSLEHDPSIVNS